jgi:3-oxoacyl-[acyl-carrier-protein] synthase III
MRSVIIGHSSREVAEAEKVENALSPDRMVRLSDGAGTRVAFTALGSGLHWGAALYRV